MGKECKIDNLELGSSIVKPKKSFTQVSNHWILDLDLSGDSYRLLCYIDMQPDDWKFYKSKIKKDLGFGEQKYTSCMKQLKLIGYIKHYPQKNSVNKITNRVIELSYWVGARGVPNQGVARPGGGYLPPYIKTNGTNTNSTKINKNSNMDNFSAIAEEIPKEIFSSFQTLDSTNSSIDNNSTHPQSPLPFLPPNQPEKNSSPSHVKHNYNNAKQYQIILDEHELPYIGLAQITNERNAMTFLGSFRGDFDLMCSVISEAIESEDLENYQGSSKDLMLHIISSGRGIIKKQNYKK